MANLIPPASFQLAVLSRAGCSTGEAAAFANATACQGMAELQ